MSRFTPNTLSQAKRARTGEKETTADDMRIMESDRFLTVVSGLLEWMAEQSVKFDELTYVLHLLSLRKLQSRGGAFPGLILDELLFSLDDFEDADDKVCVPKKKKEVVQVLLQKPVPIVYDPPVASLSQSSSSRDELGPGLSSAETGVMITDDGVTPGAPSDVVESKGDSPDEGEDTEDA